MALHASCRLCLFVDCRCFVVTLFGRGNICYKTRVWYPMFWHKLTALIKYVFVNRINSSLLLETTQSERPFRRQHFFGDSKVNGKKLYQFDLNTFHCWTIKSMFRKRHKGLTMPLSLDQNFLSSISFLKMTQPAENNCGAGLSKIMQEKLLCFLF